MARPLSSTAAAKILVIEQGEDRYGLVVDAVENIVTVADSDRMSTPRMLRNNAGTDLRSELQEVIEIPVAGEGKQTISIFEIDAFFGLLAKKINMH